MPESASVRAQDVKYHSPYIAKVFTVVLSAECKTRIRLFCHSLKLPTPQHAYEDGKGLRT